MSDSATNAIEIQHLTKRYRDKRWRSITAVDDVSFTVAKGEAFGFVGPNGAGKSTTIKTLTGLVQPTSGEAKLFGRNVADPLSRQGLGYVPESPYLYDYLTPLEILQFALGMHGTKVDNPDKHCMHWLEVFGLDAVAKKTLRKFSKGMTQRTALAAAMVIEPQLLILDEPLSGLDPVGRREVVEILQNYREQGGTLFFSSHVLYDVERLADRFGVIIKGKLAAIKTQSELVDNGAHKVRVFFTGCTVPNAIPGRGGRPYLEVARDALWQALDQIRAAGGDVVEVNSSASLEDLFFSYIGPIGGASGYVGSK
jgi:ABC-2 type transport system ATP-binding protein